MLDGLIKLLKETQGFDWDKHNTDKIWSKHDVSTNEAQQVFTNRPRFFRFDKRHSQVEQRFFVFGKTNAERLLTIIFTIRKHQIRVISARDINRGKELRRFNKKIKEMSN